MCVSKWLLCGVVICGLSTAEAHAQPQAPSAESATTMQVVIKRDAVQLLNPDQFRAPLSLKPSKTAELRARVEGNIQNVRVQPGAVVSAQEELIRIESVQSTKQVERAQAQLKAATLRRDLTKTEVTAGKQAPLALELAEAELQVAQADLELAQLNLQQASVRAPFSGEVTLVSATPGTFVQSGDLLISMRDPQELTVQIPVDHSTVKVGDSITVQLDSGTAPGKVQALLPLNDQWQPLRQLIDTAGLALVVIENKNKAYRDGQTVYSDIVPRQPILEVANTALKNSVTGGRIIQVIRDNMVRDIEVQLLGPVGEDRSYVSGPFQEKDEMITESSQVLSDGTVVQPANLLPPENPAANKKRPGTPARTPGQPGF